MAKGVVVPEVNIASALVRVAAAQPDARAVVVPQGRDFGGKMRYREHTYRELDDDSTRIARGLIASGITPGTRAALMVKPSYELFAVAFAMFKAGLVPVLVDPGIGLKNLGICLAEAKPSAFIGVTAAHVARVVLRWASASIEKRVTIGRRLGWGGLSLDDVRRLGESAEIALPEVKEDDIAAVLFTSGSTGVPKGAVYTHGNFSAQVAMLKQAFAFEPGEIDLPTFPLFALFDPALGMTTVLPEMDATRPAQVDPRNIIEPILQFGVTNMFGSPALLNRVGRSEEAKTARLTSLKRVISAGAPVPADVIERFSKMLPDGVEIFTPYGATESLPVAKIGSAEILGETRAKTEQGAGVCIGRSVEGVRVEIIQISDDPIAAWSDDLRVSDGEIGEIAVLGPNVTRSYFEREKATELAKMRDPSGRIWHRMGDLGRRDRDGRLWFCGRKAHRVVTPSRTLFTDPTEGIFNTHPDVFRTALVGVTRDGVTRGVLCVELEKGRSIDREKVKRELIDLGSKHEGASEIKDFLFHSAFPVDIRHNSKIFREKLAVWADGELR